MEKFKFENNVIIFGQEDYASRVIKYFKRISPERRIEVYSFFLTNNPETYKFFLSIYEEKLLATDKNIQIIVAFGCMYVRKAVEYLNGLGFKHILIYDAEMDNALKREFFKREFATQNKDFILIDEPKSIIVYMAKSVYDKPLNNGQMQISDYVVPIQVGAALTDKRIATVTDDTGDNISEKNRCYSETTALYWMWKNAEADYLGLCHYRRHWKNLELIAEKLQTDMIDVVLPVPTLCAKSVLEDYMKRYIPDVYTIMFEVLYEKSPEYYKASERIYRGDIFYACNMMIAKRRVLNDLCEWMFPLVNEIEKRVGELSDSYENRYAGFCTERLITLYFLYNKQNWRIAHADKVFMG